MVALTSTFLDSSVAFQVGIDPPLFCLPRSRSFSGVLALASSSFSDNLELAKSSVQDRPFMPRPRWWIPFLPGAPEEWSSNSDPSRDDADSAYVSDNTYLLQAKTVYVKPRSEAAVKGNPKKSDGQSRRVVFTPEMARKLRKEMKSNDSFHDFMYHSGIASRLASHVS